MREEPIDQLHAAEGISRRPSPFARAARPGELPTEPIEQGQLR